MTKRKSKKDATGYVRPHLVSAGLDPEPSAKVDAISPDHSDREL